MRGKLFCLVVFVTLARSASAQNGQLSLGLSAAYYPPDVIGLGGALDYRWRLGAHLEAIGQFNAMHFWQMKSQQDDYRNDKDALNLYFGGIGLGYVKRPGGFHIGLLGGGMYYVENVGDDETEPRSMPGVCLTMGTGIGQRMDLSLDNWLLMTTDEKEAAGFLPLLRFSYALRGRK